MPHTISGILLDIEGTTSSVRFVFDVMFPYVRQELAAYLAANWESDACRRAVERIAADAGHISFSLWLEKESAKSADDARRLVTGEVTRLMDGDVKATGLKELQGLIWDRGFASGQLRAEVFDDVVPALQRWQAAGQDIRIYSSGSVHAQRLFFGHTRQGNLLDFFRGHYDTNIGSKREAESYRRIAADYQKNSADILFVSDIVAELDAARVAGMQTALCVRPDNAPQPHGHGHTQIASFDEIEL